MTCPLWLDRAATALISIAAVAAAYITVTL